MYKQDRLENEVIKKTSNQTNIPISIKSELEESSGVSLDNVRVKYNSSLPKSVGALATTKGTNIDIAPNQEKHLKHELGHAIDYLAGGNQQQTMKYSGEAIDSSQASEKRADDYASGKKAIIQDNHVKPIMLRKIGMEFQTVNGNWNVRKLGLHKMRGLEITLSSGKKSILNTNDKIIAEFERDYASYIDSGYLVKPRVHEARDIAFEQTEGYKISADGEDLEYITQAFDERTEQYKLLQAVTKASEMHEKITEGRESEPFVGVIKKVGTLYRIESGGNIYYINQSGEKKAHPQATVGVKFESIPDLFTEIASSNTTEGVNYLVENKASRPIAKQSFQSIHDLSTKSYPSASKKAQAFLQLIEHYITIIKLSYVEKDEQDKTYGEVVRVYNFLKSIVNKTFIIPDSKQTIQSMESCVTILNQMKRVAKYLGIDALLKEDGEIARITSEIKIIISQLPIVKRSGDKDYKNGFHSSEGGLSCSIGGSYTLLKMQSAITNKIQRNNGLLIIAQRRPKDNAVRIKRLLKANEILNEELKIIDGKLAHRDGQLELLFEALKKNVSDISVINENIKKEQQKFPALGKQPGNDAVEIRQAMKYYQEEYEDIIERTEVIKALVANYTSPIRTQYYFKTAMAFKIRTSLSDMFSLLNSTEKKYVIKKLKKDYDPKNTLVWDDRERPATEVTLETWINTLEIEGRDAIWHDIYSSELPKPPKLDDEKTNPFGVKRSTDIGYDSTSGIVEGAILELRQLKRDVPPEEWMEVAKAVIELIYKINNPEDE